MSVLVQSFAIWVFGLIAGALLGFVIGTRGFQGPDREAPPRGSGGTERGDGRRS